MAAKPPDNDKAAPHSDALQYQTWVLKVSIHCKGCKKKVKKVLTGIEGVYTTMIDSQQHKVTVTGNIDAETIMKKLIRSGKQADLWPNSNNPEKQQPDGEENKPPEPGKEGGGECQAEGSESTGGGSGSGGKKKKKKKKNKGQTGGSGENVGNLSKESAAASSKDSPAPAAAALDPIPPASLGRPPQPEYYPSMHASYNYFPSMHAYSSYHGRHQAAAGRFYVAAFPASDPIHLFAHHDLQHHEYSDNDDGEGCSMM